MSTVYDIIIRPVLTEKTTALMEDNQYVFRVKRDANKNQIREAVEHLFDVKVSSVNTAIIPGKPKRIGRHFGRKSAYKKAIVTLAEDEHLDLFAMEADEGAV